MNIETLGEFRERMDCDYLIVKNRYLFRNGAQSDGHMHMEPPSDDNSRLLLQREFLQFKLDGLVRHFIDIKQDALNQAGLSYKYKNLPTPDANAPKVLKHLQGIIYRIREKLVVIDNQLGRSSPVVREQNQHTRRAEQQAQIAATLKQVQDIDI
jgi:hypothetical protein